MEYIIYTIQATELLQGKLLGPCCISFTNNSETS